MNMYIKIVRDDKKVFCLGGSYRDDASWGITEISGLDTIENVIGKENPANGDGEKITSERITSRAIDFIASVKNRRNNEVERRNALEFFNPKHGFLLYITNGGVTRWIEATLERFQCQNKPKDRHATMSVALMCEDPYFYSVDNYGKNIAAITGCFGFPYMSGIGKGFKTGIFNFAKKINIENTGDVDTYTKIIIEADGTVENPKIIQNDAFIRILDVLESGDVIEIDMVQNTIKKNGANCIGKVDRHSAFSGMVLRIGDNDVSFDADNGNTNMKVVLYYNLKYVGV